jgi:hypothetical protein
MSELYNALKIPPVGNERGGFEVLRAAIIDNGVHVTLRPAFDDPGAWGVVLCDIARQVAGAYAHQNQFPEAEVMQRIRTAFMAEIDGPPKAGSITPLAS